MKSKQHLTNLLEAKLKQLSKYRMNVLRSLKVCDSKRKIKQLVIEIKLLRQILEL